MEKEEGVAVVTLNRPEKLNAMNHQLSAEPHDAVREANADDDIGYARRPWKLPPLSPRTQMNR